MPLKSSCEQSMGPSVLIDTDSKLRRWGDDKDALLSASLCHRTKSPFPQGINQNPPYGKELVLVVQNSRGKNHCGTHDCNLGED